MAMPIILTAYCALIVAVSLLGGLAPLALVLTHTRLQTYLSFSAGTMLGAAFFHMLPESVEMGGPGTVRWAAVGLLALFLLERFFSYHQHESAEVDGHDHSHHDHDEVVGQTLSWGTATFGLAVHSLVGGVALASAVVADYKEQGRVGGMAWGVFLATVLHKPADAMTVVALMIRAGVPVRLAHLVNLGFALMIPLGAGLFFVGVDRLAPSNAEALTAIALAFSAGTFLCISLSDLLPELQFHSHDRLKLSAALLSGFLLMAGTSTLEML
ncbi:ZIP family metal transporter [Paludisphaera mucosa]|uniref:ZIP family metal transporter n=1 Tax=Paludisphaera mucosa TaxID=3030827 RepID=A0ABT6F774_9BACT|nr:ZIP family metal transporter [Paludisphaera mucosa]MDG3003374.1 ZIP family metal transporter [Paludisphaera mucosa]